jgi:Flp pilus assembly protein TadG
MMRARRPQERGQTLAEFALIAPLLIVIVFGLVDMARAMQSYVTLQEAAREAARYAVTGRDDCAGPSTPTREDCIRETVRNRTSKLNNNSSVATSFRSWDFPAFADPPVEDSAGSQCDAVEVLVEYEYTPLTPVFSKLIGSVPISASERLLNEPFGSCS